MQLKNKHLIGLEGYPKQDIDEIIETAFSFKEVLDRPIKKVPSLQGKTDKQVTKRVRPAHPTACLQRHLPHRMTSGASRRILFWVA